MGGGSAKEIYLGEGFGDVALRVNGAAVEVHADGSVTAYTKNDVDAYTNGAVHVHPAANDTWTLLRDGKLIGDGVITEIIGAEIGDVMPEGHVNAGWIYAGISKTTHMPFYVAPKDSGVFQWKRAMDFAAKDGSRVPSKEELDQIFGARDQGTLKDTFNVTGMYPAGWYWTSRDYDDLAWAESFSDGTQYDFLRESVASLRLVR
jgi:hypothetical protein